MADPTTYDVLDSEGNEAATLDVYASGMAVVNVAGANPTRYETVAEALYFIGLVGGSVPSLPPADG